MLLEQDFEHHMRLSRLFDTYGSLLTAKQQDCLRLYLYDDLSLSEIAAELEVSRQAVHDLLKRMEKSLEAYEGKLKVLAQQEALKLRLQNAIDLLEAGDNQETLKLLKELKQADD